MVGWQLLHQKKPIGKSQGISSAELDTASSHQLLPVVLHFGEEFTWKSTLKSLKGFRFQGIKLYYNSRDIMFLLGQTICHSRRPGRRLPKATKPPPHKRGKFSIETRSSEFLQIFTHVQQSFTVAFSISRFPLKKWYRLIYDIAQVDPPRDLRSWGSQPPTQGGESWLLSQLQGWDESGKPQHPWPSVQHLFRNPSSPRPGYIVKVLNSGILVIDKIQICSIQQPIAIYYTQCTYI